MMWTPSTLQALLQVPAALFLGNGVPIAPMPLNETSLPGYVLEYAPLVWLHSQESYGPSGIGQQLFHTTPMVDWKPVQGLSSPLTLDNLNTLNDLGNTSVFLTSSEGADADPQPQWFRGTHADDNEDTASPITSCIVIVNHADRKLDAFYFYFFAYNQGNTFLGMELGDHIGDWEHNMIRFSDGVPQAIWYSQHAGGQAFTYEAAEKEGKRPIAYAANGSHAVYSMAGSHDHTIPHLNLPFGLVVDHTDRGTLWDPLSSAYAYHYDVGNQTFQPYDASYPVNWLYFNGQWGDDAIPGGPGLLGQAKFAGGPNGPRFKQLVRTEVCPSRPCKVLRYRIWGEGKQGSS